MLLIRNKTIFIVKKRTIIAIIKVYIREKNKENKGSEQKEREKENKINYN